MLNRKLLFAGLFVVASIVGAPKELLAKDIVIVAIDEPLHWELQGTPSTGTLKLPVKIGDVLHFVFSDQAKVPHGITTRSPGDKDKVQKRGEPEKDGQFLQELGEGPSQFGVDRPSKPNQEITQLKVLSAFPPTLNLMCSVHRGAMVITLERSN